MPATRLIPPRPTRSPPLLTSADRQVTVAITGGIGAGKSEALKAFARHGAATTSSDEIVHRLLREDREVHRELTARWGPRIVGPEGADRAEIAKIVFGDLEQLAWLEGLLHPRVVREYLAWREQLSVGNEPPSVLVAEVPLLYETGGETRFDRVVVVRASPKLRAARKGAPKDERESRLLPDEEKARRADFAYLNDGSLEDLDCFVSDVMERL